mmetsp:Transcript_77165/g.200769  ORF Transcript_77165/g.200769 Transcript_77165/m.200769 type:complete len:901 (+) Transcript_77165:77-2779(+)
MADAFARRRLRRDWAEVLREPSPLVAAAPLPENIFEWHANLRPSTGPLAGTTFHVRITFPQDYPQSPPNLHFPMKEIPSFKHPNLYPFGLCLDILSSFIGSEDKHAGWSPAYTVRTLLMQLQSFLFEFDAAPQDHGGTYRCQYDAERIRRVRLEAQRHVCWECGHNWQSPHPALLECAPCTAAAPMLPQSDVFALRGSLRADVSRTRAELAKVGERPATVTCEVGEGDSQIVHSGEGIAHLSSPSPCVSVRILSLRRRGGLRLGLGTLGCKGLTHCTENRDCVAWDSSGKLVLGRVVHDGAMPTVREGDVLSVRLDQRGCLLFILNGEQTSHDPRPVWPQRPLEYFLRDRPVPRAHSGSAQLEDVHAMLSFRNASVEVLGGVELRDEGAEAMRLRRQELEEKLAAQEAKLERVESNLQAAHARVLENRARGRCRGPWATDMPGELVLAAFLGVDADDVPALMRVCSTWRQVVLGRGLLERLQICCFYTKASASQDILGFGVSAEYHDDRNLKTLSTELDVLSLTAFSQFNLRRGVWGEDFEYFLPLMLDGSHMQRALPILEQSLACLAAGGIKQNNTASCFEPWMALAVLPQLMNSFAVSLMNSQEGVTRHASEKALLGYCSFHHMLLALAVRHPCIAQVAQRKLRNFLHGQRHKSQTPDLGQLIVYCAVSEDISWQNIARDVVEEAGVRSVLWLLRNKPGLERPGIGDAALLRESFQGRLTGLRLLMFQAFFLRSIARPVGEGPDAALCRYNRQFGLPTAAQKEALFLAARDILAVNSWSGYYERLGLPWAGNQEQACLLRQAIQDSAWNGYHTPAAKDTRTAPRQVNVVRQRRPPRNERVSLRKDLQHAFSVAPQQMTKRPAQKVTDAEAAEALAARASAEPATKIQVKNRFAAFEED